MAIITKYNRLFEIRILHEYFLLADDQLSFFDLPTSVREARLEERLLYGHYGLMNDLLIEPDADTQEVLKNHRLKFIQTPIGMTVASGAKEKTINGNPALVPEILLRENIKLNFVIKTRNPFFGNYTSLPLASDRPGGYLFTHSSTVVTGPDFVSLSQPVPAFEPGRLYRPGDIADHAGTLRDAYADTTGINFWEDIEGNGYVNENDRRFLRKTFTYIPSTLDLSGPITMVLKFPNSGDTLKTLTFPQPSASGVPVDFRGFSEPGAFNMIPIPDGMYQLEIQALSGTQTRKVFLSTDYNRSHFGLIHIDMGETGPNRILSTEGAIQVPHPVFEIRLRSRKSFWRYQARQSGQMLQPLGTAEFFHNEQYQNAQNLVSAQKLITRIPQKLASLPVRTTRNMGAAELFPQPTPTPLRVKQVDDLALNEPPGRLFSDLYISHIEGKIAVVN